MKLTAYLLSLIVLVQQTTIRVDVNLQQVRFSVKDGGGAAIATLRPDDFIVEENGIRQSTVQLRQDLETPVSFVILVGTIGLDARAANARGWPMLVAAMTVARTVVRQMKPQDEVTVMTDFDNTPIVARQDVRDEVLKIEDALAAIAPYDGSHHTNRAALTEALAEVKTSKHRMRALIVIGFAPWRLAGTLSQDMLEKATGNEQEVPNYFFDVGGSYQMRSNNHHLALSGGFDTERTVEFTLNGFAEGTGGHAFHFDVNSLTSPRALSRLNTFVQQMNQDLRSHYVLDYYSTVPASSLRRVRLQPVSPDYRIHMTRSPLQLGGSDEPPAAQGSTILLGVTRPASPESAAFTTDDFVPVSPGEFLMGCSPADAACYPTDFGKDWGDAVSPNAARLKPWRVRLGKTFEIGKYEVTQVQWESVMRANPSYFRGSTRPVERISWRDIQEFLKRVNARKDGYRYRLPSEEEWEYVARAGRSGPYEGSVESTAWYVENSGRQTHPVGTKEPNPWGVYDMYGNVFEWVQNWNGDQPRDFNGPNGAAGPPTRRIRGGSWFSTSVFSRTSFQMGLPPEKRLSTLGFRLVREKR